MTELAVLAEQALLGAVLLDPERQRHLADLVTPDDFGRPWHGQVLAAIRRLASRGAVPGLAEVHAEMAADTDLPRQVSHHGVLLADLADVAPRPSHAPAYAGIVISAAIRRQVGLAGTRLWQAAADAATRTHLDSADLDPVRSQSTRARKALAASLSRWQSLPAPVRQELPEPPRDPGPHADTARLISRARDEVMRLREDAWSQEPPILASQLASAAQLLAESAAALAVGREQQAAALAAGDDRPAGEAAEFAGIAVLRELAASPSRLTDIGEWLRPEHFARAEHGEVYTVLHDLRSADMPADPVTVSWQARRRGIGIEPADLAGGSGVFAEIHARQLWRRAALARAGQAGREITLAAADPALPVNLMLHRSGMQLARLELEPGPQRPAVGRNAAQLTRPASVILPSPADRHHEIEREAAQ